MAPWMMRPVAVAPATTASATAALMLTAALLLTACASTDRPSVQADPVPRPTPLASFDASIAATIDALAAAVLAAGERLVPPAGPYQPSEPATLLQAPRVVERVDLADPQDGFVIVYDAADAAQAAGWGEDLARYLGSGFGQATYAADTRFSVAVRDDAVIFASWSPGRSSDPARAEKAFDALSSVGTAIEIMR